MLRRHERPGPRYTSYPPATFFSDNFSEDELVEQIRSSNLELLPKPLSIYLHLPFCANPCFYCGCNRLITRDTARADRYLETLSREIEAISTLYDRDREVKQVHLGGGTPNFMSPEQLVSLLRSLGRYFWLSIAGDRDFSIELDPRNCSAGDIDRLAMGGFNRASIGVQDFNPAVQKAINRTQSVEETLSVIRACRSAGLRSVNVDLIYGLPKQTLTGFRRTIETLLAETPDRFAVYGYAHMPHMFKAQRQIADIDLPDGEARLELQTMAAELLRDAGYQYIGLDHFARPEDDLSRALASGRLQRNFMGYTTHAECDLVGLGVSAISQVNGCYSQNHRDVRSWEIAIDSGRLPVWRGTVLNFDDELRRKVIQSLMCHGHIDMAGIEEQHGIRFDEYFAQDLARLHPLAADGLVRIDKRRITVTSHGRYLLRIIAACFDHYQNAPLQTGPQQTYSQAV